MEVWGNTAGKGKRLQIQVGLYSLWNSEQKTTRHSSVSQVLPRGEAVQLPIWGMSEPDVCLCSFCTVTALLSGPFLKRPLEDIPVGKEDELWRNSLRSLSLVLLLIALFGAPRSLEMPRLLVSTKWTTHTIHSHLDTFCLVGFVTSYIMQNYFCINCLKIIYVRFECIPVFLLFRLPTFLQVGRT